MKKTLIIVHALLFSCCAAHVFAGGQVDPGQALLQTDRDFARLSESSGAKTAFAAYLAPDVIMLPRGGNPINGYDNAIASFDDEAGFELLWQPQLAEVAASGEMGWTWGTYQVIVDGKPLSKGTYVNIWTLQADGNWKVRMDMGNQEPAQETPDENP